jgi:hypothetical protein
MDGVPVPPALQNELQRQLNHELSAAHADTALAVWDILASDAVERGAKRRTLLAAAARYRDDSSFVTSREEWAGMSRAMGVSRMGGVAVPPP